MNKSILITGCSRGIGHCSAMMLRERGYNVIATTRNPEAVKKLQDEGFTAFQLDLNKTESITDAVNKTLEHTGGTLDYLFNNSGYGQPGAVEDLSRDAIRKQFETNLFGPMELTNQIIPVMREQGHGRIVFTSSILGLLAMPYRGAYNASKFALEGLVDTLRQEMASSPIKIVLIEPGPIRSDFRVNAYHAYEEFIEAKKSAHEEAYKRMTKHFEEHPNDAPFMKGPEAVVKKLIKALEKKRPCAHYYVTFPTHVFMFMKRVLNTRMIDWIMRKGVDVEVD